jgi:hypothetical protein
MIAINYVNFVDLLVFDDMPVTHIYILSDIEVLNKINGGFNGNT